MTTRLECEGPDCDESVVAGSYDARSWYIVGITPGNEATDIEHHFHSRRCLSEWALDRDADGVPHDGPSRDAEVVRPGGVDQADAPASPSELSHPTQDGAASVSPDGAPS